MEIEYSLYLRNGSSDQNEILHDHADWGRKQREMLKFAYCKNQDGVCIYYFIVNKKLSR